MFQEDLDLHPLSEVDQWLSCTDIWAKFFPLTLRDDGNSRAVLEDWRERGAVWLYSIILIYTTELLRVKGLAQALVAWQW